MMKRQSRMMRLTLLLVCGVMAGNAQAQLRGRDVTTASLVDLSKQEERVAAIGQRLSSAAAQAGRCETVQTPGWVLRDIGQFPKTIRLEARRQWNAPASTPVFVSALVPDGAAARAGVEVGSGVVSVNGRTPMRNNFPFPSDHARNADDAMMERLLGEGPTQVVLLRPNGTTHRVTLTGTASCKTRFHVDPSNDEQAYADGDTVQVTSAMIKRTTENEDQLAGVIAHEMAHNILRHIPRTEEVDTPRDYTRYLPRYTNITRSMEEEADRLSIWLMAQAGYDPQATVAFWQDFGPDHSSVHPIARTHDRWQDRVAAIQNEMTAMQRAKSGNPEARPALLDRASVTPVPGQRPDIGHRDVPPAPSTPSPRRNQQN